MINEIVSICVALFALVNVYVSTNLIYSNWLILIYCLIDFTYAKTTIKIHHIFAVLLTSFIIYHDNPIGYEANRSILLIELSSIPLNINNILRIIYGKTNMYVWGIFIVLFVKLRIIDYYHVMINNPLAKMSDNNLYIAYCYIGLIGLYLLNTYWLILIIQKINKRLKLKSNSEYILKYTCFIILLYMLYIHLFKRRIYIDLLGMLILTITSYMCHNKLYLITGGVGFVDSNITRSNDMINYHIYDYIAIHLKSYTMILSNIESNVSYVSLICHIIFLTIYIKYYNIYMKYIIRIPLLLDTILLILYTDKNCIHLGLIVYILTLLIILNPFINHNQLAIHIVLFYYVYITV